MKQYTTPEQTAKLIELGFEKPKTVVERKDYGVFFPIEEVRHYSIGELIKLLEEVASVVISYSYQKNSYYVRVIIPKREGGGMCRISQIELIDALYNMVVKLKERGVI